MRKYFKSFGLYAIVFAIILAAVAYTGPSMIGQNTQSPAAEARVYSDLLQELEANNVTSVEVSRSTEVSDYGTVEATLKDGSIIIVEAPSMSTLQAKLDEKEAKKRAKQEEKEAREKERKRKNSFLGKVTNSAVNTIGREVGRSLIRGIMGSLKL